MLTASALKPPTSPSGYIEDSVYWSTALADFGELVPDCLWPTSNFTYAQMRKDPQLAGILKAYTLPIRRATWSLDPAGCRPEVAQLVADDLGLRLKGDDEPGPARTRGVSWAEHRRAALLMLTYGHMGFEQLAEIRDGKARLIALSERMPHTIGAIRINPDGSMAGVDQWSMAGHVTPQIDANRLVWYCNEREGAAWQGQSLLRPAFAPWLLKREMQRVLATSSRRFGMGVPTLEALPGSVPTPAQEQAALGMATSIRVGEQGGAVTPPGYALKLIGLTGSTPDTLAFISWLDQQMSRMALAGFMDLGQTPNGSRALGESFIDLFLLALQSHADYIADVATRQAAARIVEWNWGLDEPVPTVIAGDVGSSHQITAAAIAELTRFGALQPDPALDAWVRREWQMPARTAPYVEPLAPPEPTAAEPKASVPTRRPSPRPRAATAPSGNLRRDLTSVEAASGADFESMQQQWQDQKDDLKKQWPALAAPIVLWLSTHAGIAVAGGLLADLGSMVVPASILAPAAAALGAAMVTLATKGAEDVVAEAATQGVTLTAGVVDEARIEEAATAVVQVIASGYANGAARQALLVAAPGATADTVSAAVTTSLDAMTDLGDNSWVTTNIASALSLAQHGGRMATIDAAPVMPTLTASEVLDSSVCSECEAIDGTVFADFDAALEAYPTGRYRKCLGADRCRGMIIVTWPDGAS